MGARMALGYMEVGSLVTPTNCGGGMTMAGAGVQGHSSMWACHA